MARGQPRLIVRVIVQFPSSTKARTLPRPWPLLRSSQSPDTPAARLAFHLHRLHLTGRALVTAADAITRQRAADLAAARIPLMTTNVIELAKLLDVPAEELSRPLTDIEHAEWIYYRVSVRNARLVWHNARATWQKAGYSLRHASSVMLLHNSFVSRNSRPGATKPSPLTLHPADRLTTALSAPYGPEAFLPMQYRSELLQKLSTRYSR